MDEPSESDRFCQSCGQKLHQSDNFCPNCGTETPQADSTVTRNHSTNGTEEARASSPENARSPDQWDDPEKEPKPGAPPGAPGVLRGQESILRTIGVAVALVLASILIPLLGLGLLAVVLFSVGVPNIAVTLLLVFLQFGWFAGFALWYLQYRGYDRESIKDYLGVEMPSPRDFGLILVTWLVMIVAAAIVATVLTQVVPELLGTEQTQPAENQVSQVIEENPEIVLGAIAFMFLVVGPAEELLFRGVVQNRIRERFSKIPGIVLASLLFASVHVTALASGDPVAISMTISVLFVTSLGLGWIYEHTGNIVVPVLLHGFHNSVIVAITALSAVSGVEPQQSIVVGEHVAASCREILVWIPLS